MKNRQRWRVWATALAVLVLVGAATSAVAMAQASSSGNITFQVTAEFGVVVYTQDLAAETIRSNMNSQDISRSGSTSSAADAWFSITGAEDEIASDVELSAALTTAAGWGLVSGEPGAGEMRLRYSAGAGQTGLRESDGTTDATSATPYLSGTGQTILQDPGHIGTVGAYGGTLRFDVGPVGTAQTGEDIVLQLTVDVYPAP